MYFLYLVKHNIFILKILNDCAKFIVITKKLKYLIRKYNVLKHLMHECLSTNLKVKFLS